MNKGAIFKGELGMLTAWQQRRAEVVGAVRAPVPGGPRCSRIEFASWFTWNGATLKPFGSRPTRKRCLWVR